MLPYLSWLQVSWKGPPPMPEQLVPWSNARNSKRFAIATYKTHTLLRQVDSVMLHQAWVLNCK
jgi:hypothetical protein